jgi:ABC-type branched-subunit amino acid transport system substrate-binding protein
LAGSAATTVQQPLYLSELRAAIEAGADAILLLVGAADQIAFLAQQENFGNELSTLTFPSAVTQTRNYIASSRIPAPETNPRHRFALWETTLASNGAGTFNDRFMTRWGEVTEPTAWAAYHSVQILFEAALAAGSLDASALIQFLESPEAVFDVRKGPGVSFRSWDHQLRQPLYVVRVDQEAPWSWTSVTSRVGIAGLAAELPGAVSPGASAVDRLDQFGDGPGDPACRF